MPVRERCPTGCTTPRVFGVFLLRGHAGARWGIVAWLGYHVVLTLLLEDYFFAAGSSAGFTYLMSTGPFP